MAVGGLYAAHDTRLKPVLPRRTGMETKDEHAAAVNVPRSATRQRIVEILTLSARKLR